MNEFVRIDEALDAAVATLAAKSDSPRLDAELLLARALDVQRSYLFAHPEDEMDAAAADRFSIALEQRTGGMPMAYITGEKEFWSMNLVVTPATLVPRPETELLVDQALMRIPRKAEWQIADLGTGSGAIALALARERPLCMLTATDASTDALAVAAENARRLTIPNVEFVAGDWTTPLEGREFDLLVSNPPYVASDDPHLADLGYEPIAALDAGEQGLDAITCLAANAGEILRTGGHFLVEHGFEQADHVGNILAQNNWTDISTCNDLEGRPRVTAATKA